MSEGREKGRRGRPPGFDPKKYWEVLAALFHGPLPFSAVVTKTGLSRRFVWKVLKDALFRDVVGVNYEDHKALYFLKWDGFIGVDVKLAEDGSISEENSNIRPSIYFLDWFTSGRPNLYSYLELLDDAEESNRRAIGEFIFLVFLFERYAFLKVCDDAFYPKHYPRPLGGYTYGEIFRKFLRSYRSIKPPPPREVEIIQNVVRAFFEQKICPQCFRRGELYRLERIDDFLVCRNKRCGGSFRRLAGLKKLWQEFFEWEELGSAIKIADFVVSWGRSGEAKARRWKSRNDKGSI